MESSHLLEGNIASEYGKCPKILYTKVSDKITYANNVQLDQTAPEGIV